MDFESMLAHCMKFALLGDTNYATKAARWYAGTLPWLLADLPAAVDAAIAAMTAPAVSSPGQPAP